MTDKDIFVCAYPEYEVLRESTTFWSDFSVADAFGTEAIQDTFNRAFNEWKGNYKHLTELVGVLNHKIWQWYELEGRNSQKSLLYDKLWRQADAYAIDKLEGEELSFFLYVLDQSQGYSRCSMDDPGCIRDNYKLKYISHLGRLLDGLFEPIPDLLMTVRCWHSATSRTSWQGLRR